MKAKFKLQDNVTLVFKKKWSILFALMQKIDKELNRLIKTGILTTIDYSKWAAPTVYVKKKSKDIRGCANFLTGLNAALMDHYHSLPSPEEVFAKQNGEKNILQNRSD